MDSSNRTGTQREMLRLVSAAHMADCAGSIGSCCSVGNGDPHGLARVGDALRRLSDEHLIMVDDDGRWRDWA